MRTVKFKINSRLLSEVLGMTHVGPDVVVLEGTVDPGKGRPHLGVLAWTGQKHTLATRKKLSCMAMGRKAWNKGLHNTDAKVRMTENNPMKDPKIAQKVRESRIGRTPSNKITKTYTKICKECGYKEEKSDTKHNRINVFCDKSCAARWFNMNGRKYK